MVSSFKYVYGNNTDICKENRNKLGTYDHLRILPIDNTWYSRGFETLLQNIKSFAFVGPGLGTYSYNTVLSMKKTQENHPVLFKVNFNIA